VRGLRLKAAESMMGKAIASGEAMQLGDLSGGPDNPLRRLAISAGFKSVLFVPLIRAERAFGVLILQRKRPEPYDAATVSLLTTFASQSTLAIQNARLFREIEEKGEQLAIASQHKSQFLANMSHELRTPLNAVLGYTELIQDGVYGAMPEKVTAVLDRVQANGRHLLGLINDVLDLSKIEAGQLQLGIGEYSMRDVVHTVVAATEPLAASKKLPIRVDLAERLPSARGDERRISQVLLNLLGNAIKFTEEGEIRIAAAVNADHFVVSVSDTGPGIPVPEQEKIFEEFHQVDSSNTKVKGGTGLGLAISRRIIELHGGQITVDSDLGRGSTFTIKLPVEAVQQAGCHDETHTHRRDQADNRAILRDCRPRRATLEAVNGSDGVEVARRQRPTDPDGHSAAGARRLPGDAADQGRPAVARDTGHRGDVLRAQR
jgi:signal transduction histidine kinase